MLALFPFNLKVELDGLKDASEDGLVYDSLDEPPWK